MTRTLARALLFGLRGMVAPALWAAIFGVGLCAIAYSVFMIWNPKRLALVTIPWLMTPVTIFARGTAPLGLLCCALAGAWTSPDFKLVPLVKRGVFRSWTSALGLALVGSVAAFLANSVLGVFGGQRFPPAVLGFVAGWTSGFLGGMVWGTIESVVNWNKAQRETISRADPPISAP